MLKFLLNYPLGYYAKSLLSPTPKGPKMAFYFGGNKNMLLIGGKSPDYFATWEPHLQNYIGAPTLRSISKSEIEMGNPYIPSSFRKELGLPYKLQNRNDTHVIIEDPDTYIGIQNTEGFHSVGSLKAKLEEEPAELISLWNSYNSLGDYYWEILDMGFHTLENKESLPPKVFAVGYPMEKIQGMCRWAKAFNIQLLNIMPAQIAITKMITKHLQNNPPPDDSTKNPVPPGNFFIIFNGSQEIFLAYFTKKECLVYSSQKSTEGINTNDILKEMEEIQDQEQLYKETPIHLWGFKKDNYLPEGLAGDGWLQIKNWEPDTLMKSNPIILEKTPEKTTILEPEPWVMSWLMK